MGDSFRRKRRTSLFVMIGNSSSGDGSQEKKSFLDKPSEFEVLILEEPLGYTIQQQKR